MQPIDRKPVKHGPGCAQFKCECGLTTTFCPNSVSFPVLKNLHSIGYRTDKGECPQCGLTHWRGMTRKDA